MKAKRIHELPEIKKYEFEHSIIVDKPNEGTSSMIKLGNLVDLILSYDTMNEPIIVDTDVTKNLTLSDEHIFEPQVTGSNIKFTLKNNPDFMVIDEESGVITINPTEVGTFNNIVLKASNLFGNSSEIFSIKVINRLPNSNKKIEYLTPSKTKRIKINDEFFITQLKNSKNKTSYNTTFSSTLR